ncbi:SusD/RagB family nutrient-binding outer membrane lipoprotein [Olivibacter sp. CPCC 100613]|uniref:SusD/RagB family nutrient-binding outer membrane lipoprotein n=1 Tax=Olivibacter sp. CPCC 100613 TaxID=3079931 RepID=UPI002FF63962
MKRFQRNILPSIMAIAMLLSACDKGFEAMNQNPNAFTDPVLGNLFTTSLIRTAGTGTPDRNRTNIKYFAGTMQYMASLGINWSGDKNYENNQFGDLFETIYGTHLKELQQLIAAIEEKPELVNEGAMANIWRVFVLHRATDMYGDVPYTEAGQGYISGTFKPRYDKQSAIYPMMLASLETAAQQLDPSKSTFGNNDVLYQGDVAKWKTFAYSLMLRLGMRLSNVDPGQSKNWVEKAIAGGVMTNNDDIAKIEHVAGNENTQNWDAFELKRESLPESNAGKGPVKLGKTLIDALVDRDDPRLSFYATLWQGNIVAEQSARLPASTNPTLQQGLPNGYDANTIRNVFPGFSNEMLAEFSEPNTGTIASLNAPTIILSYSEVEFLLAEAALRGWGSGTAAEHYNKAITANMQSTSLFPITTLYTGQSIIPITIINSYLARNPLDESASFDKQMEQIFTQFWLAHFMYYDNFEAFSTWRRTGYPLLDPPNYPGNFTGGKHLVRLRYPVSEATLNKENYDQAIADQGSDLYTTPVWWDK